MSATELPFEPLPADARMEAYYYSFERTGVAPVDAILSAVAVAGKGAHNTEAWNDEFDDYYSGRPGLPDATTAVDLIQRTANQSARRIEAALSERDVTAELIEALEAVYHWILTEFAEPNPETGEVIEAGVREIWGVVCNALAGVKGETADWLGHKHDHVHKDPGTGRAARSIKVKGETT